MRSVEKNVTTNKDFKALVRARMQKTGESYAAARAQLVAVPTPAAEDEYPDLAGMSNESVEQKTGKTWSQWVLALDRLDAKSKTHTAIASTIRDQWPEIGSWWAQTVTVGYERIRGVRAKGQSCSGDFAASRSKTFPVPIGALYDAFADDAIREAWIGASAVVRTATPSRSMRLTWPDGSVAAFWFTDKGAKSSVSVEHTKLESPERRDFEKNAWAERFARLADWLATR